MRYLKNRIDGIKETLRTWWIVSPPATVLWAASVLAIVILVGGFITVLVVR